MDLLSGRQSLETAEPCGQAFGIRRDLLGIAAAELLESLAVERVDAQQHGDVAGQGFGDQGPEAPALGFVLAELVDDQQVRRSLKPDLDQHNRFFERNRVEAAAARFLAQHLVDADHRAGRQYPHIHVAVM